MGTQPKAALTELTRQCYPAEMLTPANLITALIALNFAAFAAFGIDKSHAENNRRRIRESTLLTLAMFGGTPGAYAGRSMFRHKTRKQPFCTPAMIARWVQAAVAGYLVWRSFAG